MPPYTAPDDYGWTCTPAPGGGGGGGGGGTGPEDWTEVDLSVTAGVPDNFHPMHRLGQLWRWEVSNPSAGVMRIKTKTNGSAGVWQGNQQEGLALIVPVQIVPRTFPNPAGVTGNQWRSEDCRLYIEMDVGPNGFLNDGTGHSPAGPYGVALTVGPIIYAYDTDHGDGAAFVAANPTPADSYTHVMAKKENNPINTTWSHAFTLGQMSPPGNYPGVGANYNDSHIALPFGAVGTSNRLCLQTGGQYKKSQANQANNREVGATASSIDTRVDDGGFLDWWSMQNHSDNRHRIEDMYVYVGIAAGQWQYGNHVQGTYIDITGFRYRVQPVKNRSL